MAGFDELIERLLYDVALSGSQGESAKSSFPPHHEGRFEINAKVPGSKLAYAREKS